MAEYDREFGALAAKVSAIEDDLREVKSDVRQVRDVVLGARGSWKMLVGLGTIAATLGGLLVAVIAWLWPRP